MPNCVVKKSAYLDYVISDKAATIGEKKMCIRDRVNTIHITINGIATGLRNSG